MSHKRLWAVAAAFTGPLLIAVLSGSCGFALGVAFRT